MKPLIKAMLIISILLTGNAYAQKISKYYQFEKSSVIKVGIQPQYIYIDEKVGKANVFCIGQDLNYDTKKDENDVSPSWWTIDLKNGNISNKVKEFPFASFNMFYFRPAIDEINRTIYIPSGTKIFSCSLDNYQIIDSLELQSLVESVAFANNQLFVTSNPVYGENGKLIVYKNGKVIDEIATAISSSTLAPYSNNKTSNAVAVINIGPYGGTSSVSCIEFDKDSTYSLKNIELGNTANSIAFNDGYIYVVCNGSNNTYKINADSYEIEKILHSGTSGWDGPRQISFNGLFAYISDFAGTIREVDLENGVKSIIEIGGKPEGIAFISDESFLTTKQMNSDYSSCDEVFLFSKKEYNFDYFKNYDARYEFCETCEKPVAIGGDESGARYVFCMGDSLKGIKPAIATVETHWPCGSPNSANFGMMQSRTIYSFDKYFINPPQLCYSDGKLFIASEEKLYVMKYQNGDAIISDEIDFKGTIQIKSGNYYGQRYVIALNKDSYLKIMNDKTEIVPLEKEIVNGLIHFDANNGNIDGEILYKKDNKYLFEVGFFNATKSMEINAENINLANDNSNNRIFISTQTSNSSDIMEYDKTQEKVTKNYNNGLLGIEQNEVYYQKQVEILNNQNDNETLISPSPLADIRFIDMQTGQLSKIIPMPSATTGYQGRSSHFYTLLPEDNMICLFGKLTGCIKNNANIEKAICNIYPNPTNAQINCSISDNSNIDYVNIYNVNHQLVYSSKENKNRIVLDLNLLDIQSGCYFLLIKTNNNTYFEKVQYIK